MLQETHINKVFYETWEVERIHRIGLSLYEVEQLLYALNHDYDYPNRDSQYQSIGNRLNRLRNKIINKHQFLKRLD